MIYFPTSRFVLFFLFAFFFVTNLYAQSSVTITDLRVDLLKDADAVWQNGFRVNQDLSSVLNSNQHYQYAPISNSKPMFSWVLNSQDKNITQKSYQIWISKSLKDLSKNKGEVWNSGIVGSNDQIGILYNGKSLEPNTVYYWKVAVRANNGKNALSRTTSFLTDRILTDYQTPHASLVKTKQSPVSKIQCKNGNARYDFGNDAFGQLCLHIKSYRDDDTVNIHVGEDTANDGSVQRKPRGSIRYQHLTIPVKKNIEIYLPLFKSNKISTGPRSIRMPAYIGEVMPFRYLEIAHTSPNVEISQIERQAVNYPFDDNASVFTSSDSVLNQIWNLSKHTIKATSFTGLYIDGDRERTPYEADALINQLSHYATDAEYNIAKRSLDYLIYHATWPTEWSLQNPLIAWNDYLYSGDLRNVRQIYDELKPKTLLVLAREDGLISTRTGKQDKAFAKSIHLVDFDGKTEIRDIVDWPQKGGVGLPSDAIGETDGFVFTDYNAVVNAFHYQSLLCMQKLASALGKKEDEIFFQKQAEKVKTAFQYAFLDTVNGIVKDGETTSHASLHANMLALDFGLVPQKDIVNVLSFIQSRKMACSVYGAQFLLEALYNAGDAQYALELLTSKDKRSWYNMISTGSSMTTEAWDMEYKGNQDWNHPWGAAPANIIVSKLMGITPLSPAFGSIAIRPQPGNLKTASLKLPTLRGDVLVSFKNERNIFSLETVIPVNANATIYLPKVHHSDIVFLNGKKIEAFEEDGFWRIDNVKSGKDSWQVQYR